MRELTIEELAQYNGRDRKPAYIAHRGKIYDVSRSFLWQGGRHQAIHDAGTDLTAALEQAPHGPELIEEFPLVGVLVEGKEHG
ncbi:MAG: cytochrome B5 [Anaerolineae bacterium]|nr:cytochrome B5 [Anaerolineae bacterium]